MGTVQCLGYDITLDTVFPTIIHPLAENANYVSHSTVTPYGSGYTIGDVIGVAFDSDAGELSFLKMVHLKVLLLLV